MTADDIARDLVPDDGVDIAELMQTAFDLFIGRIAGLQVFAGIVFRGLQAVDADSLYVHVSVHESSFDGYVFKFFSRFDRLLWYNETGDL